MRRPLALLLMFVLVASGAIGLVTFPSPAAAGSGFVLTGKGYGHGRGLSQYGAKSRAENGQTFQNILAFYYPGTTLHQGSDNDLIDVWIEQDKDHQLWIQAEPGLLLRGTRLDTGGTSGWSPVPETVEVPGTGAQPPSTWRLRLDADRIVLEGAIGNNWYQPTGGQPSVLSAATDRAAFAATDGTIRLITGTTYTDHRGYVAANRVSNTTLRTTVTLKFNNYLRSVVPSEMPALWSKEAVKSQAVAARTYATWETVMASRPWWYDSCNTTQCQVYSGAATYDSAGNLQRQYEHAASDAAIAETSGMTVQYAGKPAFSQFSASNGGYTLAGNMAYQQANADSFDNYPVWTVSKSAAEIASKYPAIGTFTRLSTQRDGRGSYGGRVESVVIHGTAGTVTRTGSQFRSDWALKSTLFEVTEGSGEPSFAVVPGPRVAISQSPSALGHRDWNSDGRADLLATDEAGKLFLFPGKGNASFASRQQIGQGWHVMGTILQVPHSAQPSRSSIIAIDANHVLWTYPGNGNGGFSPRIRGGGGWNAMELVAAVSGWSGSGSVGVIGRDPLSEQLWYYRQHPDGSFARAVKLVGGQLSAGKLLSVGDWNGDGISDLMHVDSSDGALWLIYRHSAASLELSRRQIGQGWLGMSMFMTAADWNGDGRPDLVSVESGTGRLWLYRGSGYSSGGGFASKQQVGQGWNGFTFIG